MNVITKTRLIEAITKHPNLKHCLTHWYNIAKRATWQNLAQTRKTFPHADQVRAGTGRNKVATVFNLSNGFRLITVIHYDKQRIYIRHILPHDEYDRGGWKDSL